jgi:cytochrome P450
MIIGSRFKRDILGFLTGLHRDSGDLVYIKLGPYRSYWVFHPDLAREVLVSKAKHFRRKGRQVDVLKQWNRDSLIISDGDAWLRQRRMVQPAFNPRRFAGYAEVMVRAAERLAESWQTANPASIEINSAMTGVTLEIIAKTLFDVDVSEETRKVGQAVSVLSEAAMREAGQPFTLPNWLPLPSIRRKVTAMRFLETTIRRIIAERRASGQDKGDLLSMLLHAVDEEGDGGRMTDEEILGQAMTLFLAGHDTTAGTLSWLWCLLASHPEVEAKLLAEVDSVLHGRTPTADDVPKLHYTEMVVKETLRLYPQAYVLFARVPEEPVALGDYMLPAGALVYVVPYVIQRDPRWFPEPDQFDPERFSEEAAAKLPPYAHIPFGAGPRVCIGAAFATMEMVLILATLIQRFHLALAPGQKLEPLPLFSLRPKGAVRMSATPRPAAALAGAHA